MVCAVELEDLVAVRVQPRATRRAVMTASVPEAVNRTSSSPGMAPVRASAMLHFRFGRSAVNGPLGDSPLARPRRRWMGVA